MANQPRFNGDTVKPDTRDARIAELEKLLEQSEAALIARRASTDPERDLKAERDYLWVQLAQIEAWALTAPSYDLSRVRDHLKTALDGFKPAVKVERVMP